MIISIYKEKFSMIIHNNMIYNSSLIINYLHNTVVYIGTICNVHNDSNLLLCDEVQYLLS